jgi:ABC-type nitrate/sulfonate/bicarbonate transport system substrate-binding protein
MDVAYTGVTVGIVARSRDQPIVVVANGAAKGTAIVAKNTSDIRTIADLKGKRVGNLPLSIKLHSEFHLRANHPEPISSEHCS